MYIMYYQMFTTENHLKRNTADLAVCKDLRWQEKIRNFKFISLLHDITFEILLCGVSFI